jgi:hypothetical protein
VVGLAGSGAVAPIAAGADAPSADLSVTVAHTPDSATAPADITFTVTASNAGPDTAQNVSAGLAYGYPLDLNAVPAGCRRSASYESVVCDLGNIASGASVSVDFVVRAQGSGLFSLPAAVASDTADPDVADRVATDTLLVKAGPSQAVRYIRGIFVSILNRNPNTATTDYWAARWKAVNRTFPRKPASVPAGIINSDEYRRLRIREAYTRILGRPADAGGLASYVTKAARGTSFEAIERTLLTSGEFTRKPASIQQLIANTYQAVLGRQPTPAEAQAAFDSQTSQSFASFVVSLQRSTEGYDRVINQRFQSALGHGPNSLGRYVWQAGLRQGQSPEALFAQLLVSNDVLALYPYTTDDSEGFYEVDVPVSQVLAALDAG